MSCSVNAELEKAPRARVSVNGVVIRHDAIARETQNHPAQTPVEAWQGAARALVIRELLLQEAARLGVDAVPEDDQEGRRETEEEAKIRVLLAREVQTPAPDEETCRRYHQQNRGKFRSPDIFEAAHILIAAPRSDPQTYDHARLMAQALIEMLQKEPARFAELAQEHSDCPSSASGGNLGQLTVGQTTPEFEKALLALEPGAMSTEPVATPYGFHVLRLERRIAGQEVPFETLRSDIERYLGERVRLVATAQYIVRLAAHATIEGVELPEPESLRVN